MLWPDSTIDVVDLASSECISSYSSGYEKSKAVRTLLALLVQTYKYRRLRLQGGGAGEEAGSGQRVSAFCFAEKVGAPENTKEGRESATPFFNTCGKPLGSELP